MRSFLLLLLCLFTQTMYAQHCAIRTVTTKWNVAGTSNTWNWTTAFYDNVYIKNRTYTTVASPFYNPTPTLQNPNLIFLQDPTVKDMQPEDGWELLVKDFGTNANLPATAVTNPFFALYNRYTATIRAFFLVVDPLSGTNNGATMSLMFESGPGGNESALLAFASPIITATDKFVKSSIMRTPNRYSNEFDYWLFADFPVAYDPCTCVYNSKITFTVQLIQTTNAALNIKLKGTSTGSIKEVIKAAPEGVQTNQGSNSVLNWVDGAVKSGQEGYKSWQSFGNAATSVANFLTSNNADQKVKIASQVSTLLNFTKAIPYVGAVAGVLDFFMGGGKQAARAAPMAFEANLQHEISGTADGKLELSTVRGYRTFNTPGANNSGTSTAIPTYDNILGVFNLLETPKVEYLEFDRDPTSQVGYFMYNPNFDPNCMPTPDDPDKCANNEFIIGSVIGHLDSKIIQYKIAEPIKYVVNPAAKMDLIEIKAALVVDDPVMGPYTFGWNHPAFFGPLPTYSSLNQRLNLMGYEYETPTRFRTPFVGLNCIANTTIASCLYNSSGNPKVKYPENIFLKIKAVFRRQDAGSTTQDVLFIGTFKTNLVRSAADPGNLKFRLVGTNRRDVNGVDILPHEYPNTYYYEPSRYIFPQPIPGIAGVDNPVYPANCPTTIPAAQNAQQISTFCQDVNKYNPKVPLTALRSANDAFRPKDPEISTLDKKRSNGPELSNAPNPLREETKISFTLQKEGHAHLYVSDINGRQVATLVNKTLPAGKHTIVFRAGELQNGTYFYTLVAGQQQITNKMVIVR